MRLHIDSTPETFSNGLLGYVILSSKTVPSLPFLSSQHHISSHIRGGVNGGTAFEASFCNKIFYPSKRVVFNAYSSIGYESQEDLVPVVDALSNLSMDQEGDVTLTDTLRTVFEKTLKPVSSLCLERSDPFGLTIIASNEAPLQLYGLFNELHSLLVVTNIDNYDSLVQQHAQNSWWVHRFPTRDSMFCVLHTRRMCHRWYRWGSNAATSNEFNRFAALERSLIKPENPNY